MWIQLHNTPFADSAIHTSKIYFWKWNVFLILFLDIVLCWNIYIVDIFINVLLQLIFKFIDVLLVAFLALAHENICLVPTKIVSKPGQNHYLEKVATILGMIRSYKNSFFLNFIKNWNMLPTKITNKSNEKEFLKTRDLIWMKLNLFLLIACYIPYMILKSNPNFTCQKTVKPNSTSSDTHFNKIIYFLYLGYFKTNF